MKETSYNVNWVGIASEKLTRVLLYVLLLVRTRRGEFGCIFKFRKNKGLDMIDIITMDESIINNFSCIWTTFWV